MNRELISKAISDIDERYIAQSMSLLTVRTGHAPERTSNMGKNENKRNAVHTRRWISLLLAACLAAALAITAYALNLFGIREIRHNFDLDLPMEVEPYIQQHTQTVAARDWNAQITESYCDPTRVMVTVTVTADDKYILAPTDATPQDTVRIIGREGNESLGDYAAAQGKEVLRINASLMGNEELGIFTERHTHVHSSDTEMHILIDAARSNGQMAQDVTCWVNARNEAGEIESFEVPVELAAAPVSEIGVFVPDDPNGIPGITFESVSVLKTPIGWTARFISTVAEQNAFPSIKRMDSDEITDFESGGFVRENDGTYSTTWITGRGDVSDTLTVHFYDWDNQPIGDIIFRKSTE